MNDLTKTDCSNCDVLYDKLEGNFYFNKSYKRGHSYVCILCTSTLNRNAADKRKILKMMKEDKRINKLMKKSILSDKQAEKYLIAANNLGNKYIVIQNNTWIKLRELVIH